MKFSLAQACALTAGSMVVLAGSIGGIAFGLQQQAAVNWNRECSVSNDRFYEVSDSIVEGYDRLEEIVLSLPSASGATAQVLIGEAQQVVENITEAEAQVADLNTASYDACMPDPEGDWSPLQNAWGAYHSDTTLDAEQRRFVYNNDAIEEAEDRFNRAYEIVFG